MVLVTDINSQFLVQVISTDNLFRSKNLELELIALGLKFIISPGVVLNENDYHDGLLHSSFLSNLICQRKIQIGEVGCALAHRNAIYNFLSSDQKFGIIFEDDAEVIGDFRFDVMIKFLDSNLPIVITLGWRPGFAIANSQQVRFNEEPIELITPPTGAFGYAINRPAAKLMMGTHEKIIDLADWPVYTIGRVKFYAINSHSPWVITNHDLDSSIIGERAIPISKSPINVLVSRMRLATYLVTLMLLSITNKLEASPKQIVHQLFIRGALHRYGVSQVAENSVKNEVVPLPLKFRRILSSLRLL